MTPAGTSPSKASEASTTTATPSPDPSSSSPQPTPVGVSNVFVRNFLSRKTYLVNQGGARSTKSWSIAQLLIQRFWNVPNRKILVTRKTGPALHLTALKLVIDLLKLYGRYQYCDHDKTYNVITHPTNGSSFTFLSVDDPEKIKSTEWNDIWAEEATEFTWDDFLIFQTRISAPTTDEHPNQIILSFNPDDEFGWINQRLVLSPAFANDAELIKSSYRDNPYLAASYIKILEGLREQDPSAARVFADGEYAQLTGVIYSPYELVRAFPESVDETIYGLDFGFNNPSGLIEIGIKDGRDHYLRQLIYQTGLTNPDLIELAKTVIPEEHRDRPIYCDAAEPDRIEEFCRAGFNAHPADKAVKTGIDFCKSQKFFTLASNVDLNKERGVYKWRVDKNGRALDEPVKFMDHLMDAKRYAVYTHNKGRMNEPGYA